MRQKSTSVRPSIARPVSAALAIAAGGLLALGCGTRAEASATSSGAPTAGPPAGDVATPGPYDDPSAEKPRGNVLILLADDLGVDMLASYGLGTNTPATPVIDQLAANGVLFRNAWANPICSPTRASIQTGKYASHSGIGWNTSVHPVYSVRGIELDEVTLPEMLDLGTGGAYRTAAIGKWHLGHTDDVGGASAPNVHGYEHFAGPLDNLDNHHVYTKVVDGQSMMSTTYALTEQVDDALAWIGSTTGPWFCYLAFSSVHGPFHAPPAGLHSVDTTPTGNQAADDRKLFEAMLEALDTEIGRLLAGIGPALDDTTIVFVGDNGTPGAVSLAPFDTQHGKATMYEGGLAVPLIVVGPDVQTPGTECDALVHASDLYATVAELARVDLGKVLPADAKLDSVSLLPYLADPTRASLRRYLTAEFFFPNGEGLGAPYVLPDLGPSICQVDLGFGGPGTTELALCGAYMALGNVVTPEISGAPPNANGMLLYAAMFLPKPFGFGTVTTLPAYEMVPFTTDALGMATLPPVKQLAIDVSVYMQAIVLDPGPGGFAISNTLRVDFLPWNLKAARSARYKLIRSSNGGPTELYDLALDPFETFDLLTGGPLSPDQADAFVRLSAVLDSL